MTEMKARKGTTTSWMLVAVFASALPFMIGAQECGSITATTDSSVYVVDEEGSSVLSNNLYETVYLPGCATFNYEQWDAGTWQDRGPNVVCVWEGYIQSLHEDASISTRFWRSEAGTYRLHYRVGLGCDVGVPMSLANCSSFRDVITPAFQVICDEEAEIDCDEMDGVFNLDTCTCCRPGAHEVQECEMGQGGTFDLVTCTCITD